MKRIFFSVVMPGLLFFVVCTNSGFAQGIGIGTTAPHPSAMLDVDSKDKGLLIPRLTMANRGDIINPAKGLMVYIIDDNSFYFYDGGWRRLTSADEVWSIKGNSGIDTAVHFIGTIDNKPIRFKVNDMLRMDLDSVGRLQLYSPDYNFFIGYQAGINNSTGFENHFNGYEAGYHNTIGFDNYFTGFRAGFNNTTGTTNEFLGNEAGYSNTTGLRNHFIGSRAGFKTTTGEFNQFIGASAGHENTIGSNNQFSGIGAGYNNNASNNYFSGAFAGYYNTTGSVNHFSGIRSGSENITGSFNTLIGFQADVTAPNLNKAGAIGFNARVSQSNSFVIGGIGADAVNVGIGTTAPQMKLDIQSDAPNSNIAIFRSPGGYGQIYVTQGASVTDLGSYATGGYTGTNTPGDFRIRTGGVERIFLQHSTGRVGIGTNSPTEAFHVAGNIAVDGLIANEAFQTPTLQGLWTNFGSGYAPAVFYKDKENRVHLGGLVKYPAAISNSIIFSLPVGYRPANGALVFGAINNATMVTLEISTNGDIRIFNGAMGWVSLDGISFRTN